MVFDHVVWSYSKYKRGYGMIYCIALEASLHHCWSFHPRFLSLIILVLSSSLSASSWSSVNPSILDVHLFPGGSPRSSSTTHRPDSLVVLVQVLLDGVFVHTSRSFSASCSYWCLRNLRLGLQKWQCQSATISLKQWLSHRVIKDMLMRIVYHRHSSRLTKL